MSHASDFPLLPVSPLRPTATPYPAAPWQAHGRGWVGLFRADQATPLPEGMVPLLGGRWRAVGLVRYLPGSTLTYDELFAGVPVRVGWRVGLYVDAMYVNSVSSLWGGRHIWGLPKELAQFDWEGDRCTVSDDAGLLATLRVNRAVSWWPTLPGVVPSFGTYGQDEGHALLLEGSMRARLGWPGLLLESWGARFPYHLPVRPILALAAKPFAATFPPARKVSLAS